MLNEEIADLLAQLRRNRKEAKELNAQLVKFAVEEIGIAQEEVSKMNMVTFLDGYLVGRGMFQSWRNVVEPEDKP